MKFNIFALFAAIMLFFSILMIASNASTPLPSNSPSSNSINSISVNTIAKATQNANLNFSSFLLEYIPNSIVEYSPLINITYSGDNYTIIWLNGTGTSFVVINTTNHNYAFLLNSSSISKVLTPYLIKKYYPSNSIIKNLTSFMQEYRNEAQPPLSDCLIESGTQNYQCSYSGGLDACLLNTCSTVPICGGNPQLSFLSTFGTSSPFAYGILNFSVQYSELNASYNKYLKLSNEINIQNLTQNIVGMESTLSNISSLSLKIPDNPIFPVPANMDTLQISNLCAQYSGNNGPWYCYAAGLCQYTSFNSTILNNLQSLLNSVADSPVTSTSISKISLQSANLSYSFYEPVYAKQSKAEFNAMLNASAKQYSSILSKLSFVNSHYSNTLIASALTKLQQTYNTILAQGINQNITEANKTLSAVIYNAVTIYSTASAPYINLYNLSKNTTSLITIQELNYQNVPYNIAQLAMLQSSMNSRLSNQINISALTSLSNSEKIIYDNAKQISAPFSLSELAKKTSIAGLILPSLNTSISNKIAAAPYFSMLLPLIIGIVIILLIYYFTYYKLNKKHKIKKSASVKKAWIILFLIMFIILFIWIGVSVLYAESANSFLPISSFLSNLDSSNTIFIVANNTSALPYEQCIASLEATLTNEGKNVEVINSTNYTCKSGSASGTACYNNILSSYKPTIIISNGNASLIHKGIYGSVLYSSGAPAEGYSCLLNNLLKVN